MNTRNKSRKSISANLCYTFRMSAKAKVSGSVVAGFPSPAEQYQELPLDLNELLVKRPAATYFVRVKGNSMVGAEGFEPPTACSQSRCATRLRYAPKRITKRNGRNRWLRTSCASRILRCGARFRRSCHSLWQVHQRGSRGRSPCATKIHA